MEAPAEHYGRAEDAGRWERRVGGAAVEELCAGGEVCGEGRQRTRGTEEEGG